MNLFPSSPRVFLLDHYKFFRKFAEVFASQCVPPVSTTPVANLPPVSVTPVANFSPIFASIVDTGGKFATGVNDTCGKFAAGVNGAGGNCHRYQRHRRQICHRYQRHRWQICHRCHWHQWQIMATISGCRNLKVILKAKIYIYVNSTTQRCPNKIIRIFLLEVFSICPTPVANL